jgi:8-oxo-dGTP diphosphatase
MSQSTPTILVVAGLIQRNGKLLACQRRRDSAFALKWEFPGGKVEAAEGWEEALRRELQEELGVEAEIGPEAYRTRHEYPGKHTVELRFYHVTTFQGTLRNLTFEEIRWATPADLPGLDFLEGDAELITLLSQGRLPLLQSQE